MNETERLHTIREIAKKTGISEYSLRKFIQNGTIPVLMCGNRAKLSISMVMDALKLTYTANADK